MRLRLFTRLSKFMVTTALLKTLLHLIQQWMIIRGMSALRHVLHGLSIRNRN